MNELLSLPPAVKMVIGGLIALLVAYFLIKFIIRQVFFVIRLFLFFVLVGIGALMYLDSTGFFKHRSKTADQPAKIEDVPFQPIADETAPRLLLAQIVDADRPDDKFDERATLEGRPYRYLLRLASKTSNTQLRTQVNDRTIFENLVEEPDLHRGEAYVPMRGVVVELSKEELKPESGLPGYSALTGIFVNSMHEVYGLRIVSPPNSKLYDVLKKGIDDDKLPVVNVAGLFFKNYARMTGDPKEPPWIKPLLVCPEPEIIAKEEPREVMKELRETGNERLLPSKTIVVPDVEERLVLEVALESAGAKVRAWNEDAGADMNAFIAKAVEKLKKRLPPAQAANPAAVLLVRSGALGAEKDPRVLKILDALKVAGVARVNLKQETVQADAKTSGK